MARRVVLVGEVYFPAPVLGNEVPVEDLSLEDLIKYIKSVFHTFSGVKQKEFQSYSVIEKYVPVAGRKTLLLNILHNFEPRARRITQRERDPR